MRLALAGQLRLVASVALILEYEAVLTRMEHLSASGLTHTQALSFVDGVAALAEPVTAWFLWRPQLRDPSDEMVLEAAVNGRTRTIVTFNVRDYGTAPVRFGIEVMRPAEALRRIRHG